MPNFDYFVVFAEMRTGSNFLESNLNALDGVTCYGEAFNPHFIGYPHIDDILGVTKPVREKTPRKLLKAIRAQSAGMTSVIGGFRYFNDHDPRVLEEILANPRCGKIVLTRNPIESYVSQKIASATGQWKLTDVKFAKSKQIRFVASEFVRHVGSLQAFQLEILNALQTSGQTAFYVDYEDLRSVEVMNGIAEWLGVPARLEELSDSLKKQNPQSLQEKVENFSEMETALARVDRFNLSRTPNFEPRRGALIPTYVAAAKSPLLYVPIKSGPESAVRFWLKELDSAEPQSNFNQKSLRAWKADRPGHRSFSVVRHPVARAHAAYCDHILRANGPGAYVEIRQYLRNEFDLPLPEGEVGPEYDAKTHRAAFLAFLAFIRASNNGQTSIRTDPAWASQTALLQSVSSFLPPDVLIRESTMTDELDALAQKVGHAKGPRITVPTDPHRVRLTEIYDKRIEASVRNTFARDYENLGFHDWA